MTVDMAITDDAAYRRAQARVGELMNNWADESELAELKSLSAAVDSYAQSRFEQIDDPGDGVLEIAYMLDHDLATLDELLPVFGGMEQFVAFMTRQRNLSPETIDAIVATCHTKREWIDLPFCKPEGWQDITLEDSDCCDEDTCPMDVPEWRERLKAYREEFTGIGRIGPG